MGRQSQGRTSLDERNTIEVIAQIAHCVTDHVVMAIDRGQALQLRHDENGVQFGIIVMAAINQQAALKAHKIQ
ncbi:hypothetical protein D3C72_2399970 [compost metagenome]